MSLPESGDSSTARSAEVSQNNRPVDVAKFDVSKIEVKPATVGKISTSAAAAKIAAVQSRRGNLMIAMIALLFVGTANLALGGYGLVRSTQGINAASRNAEANHPSVVAKQQIRQATESATLMSRAVFGTQMLIGAVYLLLGVTIHHSALNKAILGLVIYAAMIGGVAAIEPAIVMQGLVGQLFVGAGLIAAVVGAYLYERGAKPAQTSPKA